MGFEVYNILYIFIYKEYYSWDRCHSTEKFLHNAIRRCRRYIYCRILFSSVPHTNSFKSLEVHNSGEGKRGYERDSTSGNCSKWFFGRKLFINVTSVLFQKSFPDPPPPTTLSRNISWLFSENIFQLTPRHRVWHNIELRGVYIYMNYSKSDFSSAVQKLVRVRT